MAEAKKLTKTETSYGAGKEVSHCGNCKFFQPDSNPFAAGTCKKVLGAIQWYNWCLKWEAK